ncbi:MAG: hypothetical protein M3454_17085, partial [Actinomycetota bacterium]|nr:hypothetical protein [Actinomycetota bacterium]
MPSSQAIAADPDAERSTVVVHATIAGRGLGSAEIEGGLGLHPDIAQRLTCDARLQYLLSDREGNALGIGRASRNVPRWLQRQLLRRDYGCTFPGCGTRMFLKAHHIHHWEEGRAHRLRQPRAGVHLPPQAGARGRLERVSQRHHLRVV